MRVLFLSLLFTSFLFVRCKEEKLQKPYVTGMEGKSLPQFAIQLVDSVSWLRSQDIPHGKPLIIFYYSPKCPYCRAQMRDILNNIESFNDTQLYVLTDASLYSIKEFISYFKLNNFPNVIAGRDTGAVILHEYKLRRVPFLASFDKTHKLKVAYEGRLTSHSLLKIR